MGGTTSTTNAQQQSKVELPAWVDQASQSNYQLAQDVANRPLQQYEGQRVADPSAMTTQGYDQIKKNVGSLDPYFDQATGAYNKANSLYDEATGMYRSAAPVLGKAQGAFDTASSTLDKASPLIGQAADVYGRTTGTLDINPYLNPYTNEVEQRAIGNANTALTQQMAGNASAASKAGAFGGSRFGVQQGVTQAEGARGIGDLSAALRKAGIDFATTTALQDRAGQQAGAAGLLSSAAGYGNQAAGYGNVGSGYLNTAAGIGNNAAGLGATAGGVANTGAGYLNTAAGKGAAQQQDVSNLMTAGQQDQAQQQRVIDAAMGKFSEAQNYPVEQLNIRLAALGMSPYGKTETGSKTSTTETPIDWATLALGGATALPSLMKLSDRNTKTDIQKVSDGEIPMYAYRYKGDPKTYPKIVGPMAQDIEKKFPSAVKKVGRHKTVDYNNLMEVLK